MGSKVYFAALLLNVVAFSLKVLAQDANDHLLSYFAEYEDFDETYCVSYTLLRSVEDSEAIEPDLRGISGVVAIAKIPVTGGSAKYIVYASEASSRLLSPSHGAVISEFLSVNGRVMTKNYSATDYKAIAGYVPIEPKEENGIKPMELTPILHPHALPVLSFMGLTGSRSDFQTTLKSFLNNTKFIETFDREKRFVKGKWESLKTPIDLIMTFDSNEGFVPTLVEYVPRTKDLQWLSKTRTSWMRLHGKEGNERLVPKRVEISGRNGRFHYNFDYSFTWPNQDEWRDMVSKTNWEVLQEEKGDSWWKAISSKFSCDEELANR